VSAEHPLAAGTVALLDHFAQLVLHVVAEQTRELRLLVARLELLRAKVFQQILHNQLKPGEVLACTLLKLEVQPHLVLVRKNTRDRVEETLVLVRVGCVYAKRVVVERV